MNLTFTDFNQKNLKSETNNFVQLSIITLVITVQELQYIYVLFFQVGT